ncbi:transporter [Streptomyces sp. NPDC020965]|uniref:transporter n=1 Tax=Streptomyces sp. NPDC020965 TaxID=3365105 RepID=UPI0037B199DD
MSGSAADSAQSVQDGGAVVGAHGTDTDAQGADARRGAVDALPTGRLAGIFVRLKLSLLRNGLRQSTARTAVFVISLVFALLVAAGQLLGLILLRGNDGAASVSVLLTGVLALGWAVMPLFFASGDETLDPTRLVMLPLRPRPLVTALLTASLVGIGPLFSLCLVLGAALAVAHGTGAALVAVVAVPLTLLVCVALARAVAAANIRLLTSRKGRDLALLSGLLVAVGLQVVNFGAQRLGQSGGLSALEPATEIVRWLPPAAAIGAIDSASEGSYGVALAQLALTAGALYAVLRYWEHSLTRLMTAPDGSTLAASSGPDRAGSSSGLHRLLPGGRTGTVMQRFLRYVWRDPKTKATWVTGLAIGLIVPLFNALQGTGSIYFATFAAGMLGVQMYNQFGQDTSAFWMVAQTLSTTRDAYDELRARALALLLITLPYSTLVTVVTAAVLADWQALPSALGLSYAVLGAMLGTGAVSSARFAYSIPQDNAYKNVAPGQGAIAWISLFGGMVVGGLLCAPVIALTIWAHLTDAHGQLWLVLPLGAAYGVLMAWVGLRLAAPWTAQRLPEIITAVSKS